MAWINDSLTKVFAAVASPFGRYRQQGYGGYGAFTHQLALAAYASSGLLRKVINIPASDRVREWRDWQADGDDVGLIEDEERRLGLKAKVREAEVLRGIGGGALILVTAGDHAEPLNPATLAKGGLIAVNVVSRWQIRGDGWIKDLSSPQYGQPARFLIDSDGKQTVIHPSRVVCFRGPSLPAGSILSDEEAFWGDSRLAAGLNEVQNSDNAQAWIAALIKKAKLTRIGIANLSERVATADGLAKVTARVGLIAEGENSLNATVYDKGDGNTPAEEVNDYQMVWNGIPAMLDAFLQSVATVYDIPFTRLTGRSPAGMNATGAYDDQNWAKTVSAGQQLETRPCLEQIDPVLLASAGIANQAKVSWKWAPLWAPTEKENADTFYVFTQAVEKLQGTGTVPEQALAKGVQNTLSDREDWLVGIDAALSEIPEDERFGIEPSPDGTDPSALTNGEEVIQSTAQSGGADGSQTARRAANDAKPIPLYVQRKLLNADELIAWAKKQGFTSTLPASDMHVTVLYSRTAVDPIKMGTTWSDDRKGNLTIKPGGPRAVEKLGDAAVVLLFASDDLSWRHRGMVEAGASHDYDEYQPHVTLTYDAGDVDLDTIKPFVGELRFGPELFEPLNLDWKAGVTEE